MTRAGWRGVVVSPRTLAVLAFLLCVAIQFWLRRNALEHFAMQDPDDALRLVQVRDLLAGQNWFDVTQYRINPPQGGGMHWSRLVDLPLATGIVLLRPLLGQPTAELVVCAVWPPMLLGVLAALVFRTCRRLGDDWTGAVGVCVLGVTTMTVLQFAPLRIDHHGTQALLAFVALAAAIGQPTARNGAIAGLALALHANISIEALPYMLLFAGVFALPWLVRGAHWERVAAYLATLTLASALILLGTHGWKLVAGSYCDALSRPYLAGLAGAAVGALALHPWLGQRGLSGRIATLAGGALLGAGAFALSDPKCLGGPFEALPPLVQSLWYNNVKEGLPIWRAPAPVRAMSLVPSLVGLLATAVIWWRSAAGEDRRRWAVLLILASGAFFCSIILLRAMYVAHLFVLPGTTFAVVWLWRSSRRIRWTVPRILATVGVVALTPAPAVALAVSAINAIENKHSEPLPTPVSGVRCTDADRIASLQALPPSILFAPLDLGPDLLMNTRHSVVATGHHRNARAIDLVMKSFIADPTKAEPMVRSTGARYVVMCPGRAEIYNYRKMNPRGLAAVLAAGRPPAWLEAIPAPRGIALRVWRLRPAPAEPTPAA